MSRDLCRTQKFGGMGLGLLAVLLFFVLPLRADIHPVFLDKTTDAAKCLECHASDDSREFGDSGPTGPHGSIYPHILERNYQFTQAAVPGGIVNNTHPTPDLSPQGPYALCAKCHDLNNIISNASWPQHSHHISSGGFSCSVCHTAHGLGSLSAGVSEERLVNFDIAVVGQNQTAPISYNRALNTCTLTCHNAVHNANGTVSVNGVLLP